MPQSSFGPRGQAVLAAFTALAVLAVLPILLCRLPPILDYPNHMARMHILGAAPLSGSLARYYAIDWSAIPDLAGDAVVPVLARIMPVETAMRLFLAVILLGLAAGCVVLYRACFRQWSLWPLTAFLLLYNRMLLWGFLNYLAGVALALWALAAWIALEHQPAWRRVAVGMVLATAIYLAHLAAFGCYALALLAFAAASPIGRDGDRWQAGGRRVAVAAATLIPAVLLFLSSPTSGAPTRIAYGNPLRKFDLPVSIFDNYDRIFDGATFAVVLVATVVGLARGAIRLHPRLRWSVAAVIAAFILLPSQLLTASGIDHRLPIAIAFVFVAASQPSNGQSRGWRIGAAILLCLFVARMAVVTGVWVKADHQYAALLPVFDAIAPGAAVAVAAPASGANAGGVPLLHFPTLAVIARDAFVSSLFADPFQQPVRLTEAGARLAREAPAAAIWQQLADGRQPSLPGYDDLIIVDPPSTLDRRTLPGTILFDVPRLLLVRLTPPSVQDNP